MCLSFGCFAEEPGAPWPPPLDDRLPWSGEWPGLAECREFGWFVRHDRPGPHVRCAPDAPGATADLNRLLGETEWHRGAGRRVLTPLARAFAALEAQGIDAGWGWYASRRGLRAAATATAPQGLGYAHVFPRDLVRRQQGRPFALHFVGVPRPRFPVPPLTDAEVGRRVSACLAAQGVEHQWGGDPAKPIRVAAQPPLVGAPTPAA
jgi:hypothetical protein